MDIDSDEKLLIKRRRPLPPASQTMFMTLAARAAAPKLAPETGFRDPYAEAVLDRLPEDLSAYTNDALLVRSVALRAALLDNLAVRFIKLHVGTIGMGLGCGLCSRGLRLRDTFASDASVAWYDLDLPEVIAFRNHYNDIFPADKTIGCSLDDPAWLDDIVRFEGKPLLLVMEGVAPYLSPARIETLLTRLGQNLGGWRAPVELIFDFVHPELIGNNRRLAVAGDGGVVFRSGFTGTESLLRLHPSIRVEAEHHFIENISIGHAAFNREFCERTGGAHPYTVVQLRFDHQAGGDDVRISAAGARRENTAPIAPSKKVRWNPCYLPVPLSPVRMLLIGETDSFLLEGEDYRELLSNIDGTRTKEEIALSSAQFRTQAHRYYLIETLMERDFIRYVDNSDRTYFLPDFTGEQMEDSPDDRRLIILSHYPDRAFFKRWFAGANHPAGISIVIADDYLDPRLHGISTRHCRENRPWVLLKPTGRQPLIGPCFFPGDNRSPCLHCLTARMKRNQPVRRWLQERGNKSAIPVPIAHDEKIMQAALALATEKIGWMLRNRKTTVLWSMQSVGGDLQAHRVIKRPQCPRCGDPAVISRHMNAPVELQSCVKISCDDGGTRMQIPSMTVERLMPLVSPLTGVINDLSLLPDRIENGIPVYRSSFFRSPAGNANPQQKDFFRISLGKGFSAQQSMASALSESVERYAAHYDGDEYVVVEKTGKLDAPAILPDDLVFYSHSQVDRQEDRASAVHDPGQPSAWTVCWSLTSKRKHFIPFSYCYYNSPREHTAVRFNSNGCAAGNSREEAILQGFFELIERDAVAIWWYNRICRPQFDIQGLPPEVIRSVNASLGKEWDFWLLDVTHDFRIPVAAAIGRHKKTEQIALGFGCHLKAALACGRALTELCQLIAVGDKGTKEFDFRKIAPEPYLFPSDNNDKQTISAFSTAVENSDMADDIHWCVQRAKDAGFELFVHDYSRMDLPLHVVKVIVPGLCHIWPQLGNARLYDVPVKLGWLERRLEEHGLNPLGLTI